MILLLCCLWIGKCFTQTVKEDVKNKRISFIIGPGASVSTTKLYSDPIVNQTNSIVTIEKASRLKTNLAVGIVYTPKIFRITSKIKTVEPDGTIKETPSIERVVKGRTGALFINPLALSKATEEQPFFNMVDFGVGYGHRFAGGLLLMATVEFFSVKQPRNWFIIEYENKNKPYSIEGAAQNAIDINDNSIFKSRPVVTIGFKLCYTFDIIKNYTTTMIQQSTTSPPVVSN